MKKIGRRALVIGAAALMIFFGTSAVRYFDAPGIAHDYFAAVQSGRPDYGYSLLAPVSRQNWTYEEYAAAVTSADWSRFSVTVSHDELCDDGRCEVCIDVPTGLDSIPPFLRATENRASDGVIVRDFRDECGNAIVGVWVRMFPDTARGMQISPKSPPSSPGDPADGLPGGAVGDMGRRPRY